MMRLFNHSSSGYNGDTTAGTTEYHVLKRIFATVMVAACMLDANAQNQSPAVNLVSPFANDSFVAPANVIVMASATDIDGTVSKVVFYQGSTVISTKTSAPFSLLWNNVPIGSYTLTAQATDNSGAVTTSAPVAITVRANVPPTVSITAPASNAQYVTGAVISLSASAADTDGSISKVAYYAGTTLIGSATTAPFAVDWTNAAAGSYSITAKATDNNSGVTTSAAVPVTVSANTAPAVSLIAPANNASFAAPGEIALSATAADSDGSIAMVEFFNGGTLLATVTQAPYSYTWSGVAAGSYAVTARATDNLGLQTSTAVSTVTVAGGAAQVYYIYSDQIETAREITNAAGVMVWQSDTEPFGANPPNENPAGQGQFGYNQRFPGQYFDRETGLHYNYHRDYDPQTGRYIQSDPIGLDGGINTYGYVGSNPLSRIDPLGLSYDVRICWFGVCPPLPPPGIVEPTLPPSTPSPNSPSITDVLLPPFIAVHCVLNPIMCSSNDVDPMAAAQGNVADTQIVSDYGKAASECRLGGTKPDDPCDWLEKNAGKYSAARVKATQKAWGCRGSRHGKGGKGR